MTDLSKPTDLRRILLRAANSDLWQEGDGSTREFDHEYFGYSDYLRDVTTEAEEAARRGLIELRGAWRRWALTEAGEQWLTDNEENA